MLIQKIASKRQSEPSAVDRIERRQFELQDHLEDMTDALGSFATMLTTLTGSLDELKKEAKSGRNARAAADGVGRPKESRQQPISTKASRRQPSISKASNARSRPGREVSDVRRDSCGGARGGVGRAAPAAAPRPEDDSRSFVPIREQDRARGGSKLIEKQPASRRGGARDEERGHTCSRSHSRGLSA